MPRKLVSDGDERFLQVLEAVIPALEDHEPAAIAIQGFGDARVDDRVAPVQKQGCRNPVAGVIDPVLAGTLDQRPINVIGIAVGGGLGHAFEVPQQIPGGKRRVDQEEMREGKPPGQVLGVKAAHGAADDDGWPLRALSAEKIIEARDGRIRSVGRVDRRDDGGGRQALA